MEARPLFLALKNQQQSCLLCISHFTPDDLHGHEDAFAVPKGHVGVTEFTRPILTLQNAPRTVIGYHGCSQEDAERIFAEQRFLPSTRAYDWLGEGFYFWEYAPYRAFEWAEQKCEQEGGVPAVIRATIKLGRCLNLLDIEHIPGLLWVYGSFADTMEVARMPHNTERGAHFLDREIIDAYCRAFAQRSASPLQTVRGSFAEGAPIYPGSKILTKGHTQIAVRDTTCVLRASLVQFP